VIAVAVIALAAGFVVDWLTTKAALKERAAKAMGLETTASLSLAGSAWVWVKAAITAAMIVAVILWPTTGALWLAVAIGAGFAVMGLVNYRVARRQREGKKK
jgi:hypothetical protein